jgi:hypothetical protein
MSLREWDSKVSSLLYLVVSLRLYTGGGPKPLQKSKGKKKRWEAGSGEGNEDVRRFDVPATEIELDYRDKSFGGIFNRRHGEEGFGMGHETIPRSARMPNLGGGVRHDSGSGGDVLGDALQHGPGLENKSR